jgi:hypothetical protein
MWTSHTKKKKERQKKKKDLVHGDSSRKKTGKKKEIDAILSVCVFVGAGYICSGLCLTLGK